jgi:hypothetical protein
MILHVEPTYREQETPFVGGMKKITGVIGFKKVWFIYRPIRMVWIETPRGEWVGDEKFGLFLYKRGINPELAPPLTGCPPHNVCSIGWCEREQRWYGWSHRAMCGFEIGDVVKEGDCAAFPGVTEECLKEHPEWDISLPVGFEAKSLDDCRRMAIAFAESVS